MEGVSNRAYRLSEAGPKDRDEYEAILTSGSGRYRPGTRECPNCGKDRVCTVDELREVFRTSEWGATAMLESADLVCSYCHSVRIDVEEPDLNPDEGDRAEVDGMEW